MRLMIKSCGALLIALLCSLPTIASADIVVYTESQQLQLRGTTWQVRYSHSSPEHNGNVIVVNKLATYWVKPAHGVGRIRITVPVQYYLTSWDVKALERELERLGIKIKQNPQTKPVPKPGPVAG